MTDGEATLQLSLEISSIGNNDIVAGVAARIIKELRVVLHDTDHTKVRLMSAKVVRPPGNPRAVKGSVKTVTPIVRRKLDND